MDEHRLRDDRGDAFRLFINSVRDYAIFMLDARGHIASWNRGAERLKGYTADEVLGRHFSIFYSEQERLRQHPEAELREALQSGSYQEEGWRFRKNGERFWAHVTITAVRDEQGQLLGYGKVVRDRSEWKRSEEELRAAAERLRDLEDNIHEVFWIITPDLSEVLYVSPAYTDIWGRSVASAYADPRAWVESVHPDDRARVEAAVAEFATGANHIEYRIMRADGAVRWLHTRGFPVTDETGVVRRVVGVVEDITERKEREEEQRYLGVAGHILTSSLDYEETLRKVARLAVPEVADWCAVYIAEEHELRIVEVAHRDPAKVALALEFRRRYPPDPAAQSGAYRVFQTGEPELIAEISDTLLEQIAPDDEYIRMIQSLGLRSAMTVPMTARGRTVGVISFVAAESTRRYDANDLAFAEALATWAALAVDNARLHRAEQAARQRSTNILESITDAFIAVDREWRFSYLNPGGRDVVSRLVGRDPDEVIGEVLWDAVPALAGTRFEAEYLRAMADQKETHFEAFLDAWQTWFDVHVYPAAEGLSIFFHDITPRKTAEQDRERLLQREQFLARASTILASSLDYAATLERVTHLAVPALADYCIVDVLGDNGRLRRMAAAHVDAAKEDLLLAQRYPPAPGSRSPALGVLERGTSLLVPETTDEWIEDVAQTQEHLELMRVLAPRSAILAPLGLRDRTLGLLWLVYADSDRRYTEDDRAIAEELARRAAIAIENARLYRAAKAARGEAERRAREEAALRDATGAVTASFTVEEVIRQISESALTATNSDGAFVERIQRDASEVEVVATTGAASPPLGSRLPYAGSYAELVVERKAAETIARLGAAERPLPADMAERYADCSALVLPLVDAGEPIGALSLVRAPERMRFRPDEAERALTFADLAALAFRKVHILEESERRREELERVTESRARLMRGFSHDLKNPLGAADGFLQLIEEGIIDGISNRAQEGVTRARRALSAALTLIDDLLDLARAEAGQIEVRLVPTDMREAARELTEEYRAQAEAKGIEMYVELPREFPLISSDAARVRQILGNLLSNAIKYTPSGGRVDVRTEVRQDGPALPPGDWATVTVSDTGPGIPHDQQRLLFEEFTRLETARDEPGAGIGLAISRRVAKALGGELTVASEQGRGSAFTVWLPLVREGSAGQNVA